MTTSVFVRAIRLIWGHAAWWLWLSALCYLVSGLMPLATLWVMKELINAVSDLIQTPDTGASTALWLLLGQFALALLSSVLRNLQEWLDARVKVQLDHELQLRISQKTSSVPYAYYDLPDFHHHLSRVSGNPAEKFLAPIRSLLQIGENGVRVISLVGYLLSVHWSLAVISMAAAFPMLWVQAKFGKKRFFLLYHQTPRAREAGYLTQLLMGRESAKEVRLFGMASYLLRRWSEKFLANGKETLSLMGRQQKANVFLDGATAGFYGMSAVIIIWLTKSGSVRIGDFVALGQAVFGTQGAVNQIAVQLAGLYEQKLFLRDFFHFLEYEVPSLQKRQSREEGIPFPERMVRGIEVEDVSFIYPGTDREVLRNVTFSIRPGERVAIVGENGSGKTTLVKCLMGLYEVTKGGIFVDGIPLEEIEEAQLRQQVTVIFQDFVRYAFTVRENILLGGEGAQEAAAGKLEEVAEKSGVGAIIERLPEGYDTVLGKILSEGTDLSGGQWQKIALARALYRSGQIFVLDEPTAALDPVAEMTVFHRFDQLTQGKTAIFISHRMAAARMADRILVMKDGKLAEMGTHRELLALGGEYARMYEGQAQWYAESP